jgi:pseudoazurin
MNKTLQTTLLATALLASASFPAFAEDHVVNLLNKGSDGTAMVFEPNFLRIAVGDTVKFEPVDKGHFVQNLPALWPAGVPDVKGAVNEELVVKFDKDGLYAFKCAPHFPMGMVALIQVGNAPVTDAVKAINIPGPAGKRLATELDEAAKP